MRLVECVPNFSEGRNQEIIKQITDAIASVNGASLLDVDPGAGTNRTVVTFVADPDIVVEAAFRGIEKAAALIDMSVHKGAHARMGATDVCPFIPVSGVTVEECIELSRALGRRVGDELGIPVYLYEQAATRPDRRSLPDVRKGEYEGLATRFEDPDWAPDFGPAEFNERSGATVTGVRPFLIAYNINLNTKNAKLAKRIGFTLREKGRVKRDDQGKIVRDAAGKKVFTPGLLKECKATGWFIPEYDCAQVTMNLTDFTVSPVHRAFDLTCAEADKLGLRVTGSELVGLIPLEAMRSAGLYYLEKQGACRGVTDRELVRVAIESLGLSAITPFIPDEKIIEYRVGNRGGRLVDMVTEEFVEEVGSDSPAPGGGSVASLASSMGGALVAMVGTLTWGKKDYKNVEVEAEALSISAQELRLRLLSRVDEDTESFNDLMACRKMPRKTDEQKALRNQAIQDATKRATSVPMSVLEDSIEVLALANRMVDIGNVNSISDAGVAGLMAKAGAEGAYYNVLINLPGIEDAEFVESYVKKGSELLAKAEETVSLIRDKVMTAMKADLP